MDIYILTQFKTQIFTPTYCLKIYKVIMEGRGRERRGPSKKGQTQRAETITTWISCYEKQDWFYISVFLIFSAKVKK